MNNTSEIRSKKSITRKTKKKLKSANETVIIKRVAQKKLSSIMKIRKKGYKEWHKILTETFLKKKKAKKRAWKKPTQKYV